MWCQQTPLLGKHKLRSQALVGDFRQPPSIHNIGTYPPQNGPPACDTTPRLTHKRPPLRQSRPSRTRDPTHPAAAVHRQRPSPDRTKLRMTNTCEQTKHSIHGIQNFLFKRCQQTPLLGKHKLRSQALVDEIRQPPSIHNIGTYPPPNGHAGCDTTHRLTHKRPHLCQSSLSRTRQPTHQKKISSRSPLEG